MSSRTPPCCSAALREGCAMDVVADIRAAPRLESDELWFKDAIIYQLHVKAFADSNNDGIGDFAGLTEKLDYLEDLGVTALWLLPFYPSPGRDDGYDISDYRTINADFGTMFDFRRFMQEARRRKLRVLTELVVNHTSDQHPWFVRARQSKPASDAATGMYGVTTTKPMRARASSSATPRNQIGRGTRLPGRIIGTASFRISRISITTIRGCLRP